MAGIKQTFKKSNNLKHFVNCIHNMPTSEEQINNTINKNLEYIY